LNTGFEIDWKVLGVTIMVASMALKSQVDDQLLFLKTCDVYKLIY